MCGICGIINFDGRPVDRGAIQRMMDTMKYRGPDDEGIFLENFVGLGHVRLSILDLSPLGHQPMVSQDGRYVIVYNGEVYNYIELKAQLVSKYTFKSTSDTEVLLYAYLEWGPSCLDRLDGMFAFAVYDRQEQTLFAARDRYGIKPFYYYCDNHMFLFASEIPPMLPLLPQVAPDDQTMFDYLVFDRTNHTARTFFKDIHKLLHGHTLTVRNKHLTFNRWYILQERVNSPFASVQEYREVLASAVGLRLRSDVPVGACLSGGIDSSSIVSLMARDFGRKDVHTFSATYGRNVHGDESAYIDEYRPLIRNMHAIQPSGDSLFQDLESFVRAQGEPIPRVSAYAEFKVMELAKQHVTVLLNGQGADEELAGYYTYFGFLYKELLLGFRLIKLLHEMEHDLLNHRSLVGLKSFLYFLLPLSLKNKFYFERKGYVTDDLFAAYAASSTIPQELYSSPTLKQALIDHFEHKFEHHLMWGDRSSMWFSLELRFPFLDYRMVERSLALPTAQMLDRGTTKIILRQAMQGTIPETIRLRQDKVGFETPVDRWFREPRFVAYVNNLLASRSFGERGYIDVSKAQQLYRQHCAGKINIGDDIWKWINLELWFRKFIDQPAPAANVGTRPVSSLASKNILYITHDYYSFTKDQIELIAPHFNHVYVLVRYKPVAEMANVLPLHGLKTHRKKYLLDISRLPRNVTVIPVPLYYLPTDQGYKKLGLKHARAVVKILKRHQISFDLVHCHFVWSAGAVGRALKERYHVPFMVTAHGYDIYDLPFRDQVWRQSIRDILQEADSIITVGEHNKTCIRAITPTVPVQVIPNGFRQDLFFRQDAAGCRQRLNLPLGKKIILCVGSLDEVKGHTYLIEAMRLLIEKQPEVVCVIIGDGPLKRKLQQQINDVDLQEHCRLAGSRAHNDIPDWMNACDLVVLPSLAESFGVVQIEAMACGKPVVATATEGSKSIITADDYGLLSALKDPLDLAGKIRQALARSWDHERIMQYASTYTWENVHKKILMVYENTFAQ